jgi:hypothetical protein
VFNLTEATSNAGAEAVWPDKPGHAAKKPAAARIRWVNASVMFFLIVDVLFMVDVPTA